MSRQEKLRKLARDPKWRARVSRNTRRAMRSPAVRRRHLAGLRKAREIHGVNFKGGNGQRPVEFVLDLEKLLEPVGFVREHTIGVKGRIRNYKVDFAHVEEKIAIECDGPAHRSYKQKAKDANKDKCLKNLGWRIIRVRHD